MISSLACNMRSRGLFTRVLSAITAEGGRAFIRRRAVRHVEKGRVVIFAAGTGNHYFTTDTAAALRAIEVGADVVLKGTRVDGVYDQDPERHADASRYEVITYLDVLNQGLKVMDATAVSLCMDNKLPIVVFDIGTRGNLKRVVEGEPVGTLVGEHAHA